MTYMYSSDNDYHLIHNFISGREVPEVSQKIKTKLLDMTCDA